MKRSKHTLSNYRMITGNMGQLMPLSCVPVLPGDTVQAHTSALVRVSPLNTPVMHPVSVRVHSFFVPNRITFPEWEDFITGGDGTEEPPEIPTITTTNESKDLLAYLGLPPIAGVEVSALPIMAFNMTFNEYYRDQDLVPKRDLLDTTIPLIAWEKDYFSSARPFSQKGPAVSLPMGERAPIRAYEETTGWDVNDPETRLRTKSSGAIATASGLATDSGGGLVNAADVTPGTLAREFDNLWADLSNAESPSVNDFRAAFSIQRYQEARARYGSRFTEYLRYLGISPSDARLQRPEWLGGGSTRLSFSEVLQTAPDSGRANEEEVGVGDMYGHGIAGLRSNRYRKFFEEHGYILTLLSVRPKALYMNGIHRDWLKTTKEDFYQRELVNLGQQEVYQAELYAENTRDVFGYQDRYHEYRSHPSQISNDFRDTLNSFHLGRDLQPDVTLNQAFIECDPSRRIFQITDETVDTLWIMANNHMVARRLVPKRANPRIL